MPAKVIACSCKHFDQDKIHGKGQRAHNQVQPKVTPERWRCTVCGNVTSASTPPQVAEAKKNAKERVAREKKR